MLFSGGVRGGGVFFCARGRPGAAPGDQMADFLQSNTPGRRARSIDILPHRPAAEAQAPVRTASRLPDSIGPAVAAAGATVVATTTAATTAPLAAPSSSRAAASSAAFPTTTPRRRRVPGQPLRPDLLRRRPPGAKSLWLARPPSLTTRGRCCRGRRLPAQRQGADDQRKCGRSQGLIQGAEDTPRRRAGPHVLRRRHRWQEARR